MNWRGIKAGLLRQKEIRLPVTLVEDIISRHGAQSWFVYAHTKRRERKHVWWPSFWLAARLNCSSRILETGCGCGLNLLWFAEHGFTNLYGSDIDANAIAAGQTIFKQANLKARLWVDDGLNPSAVPAEQFDIILALNWTYHVETFELGRFFEVYQQHLSHGGYFVIDLIDNSYNNIPNNQYLTSDWGKPEELRQPTEYKKRYSQIEVRESARQHGFRVIRSQMCSKNVTAPRRVYILSFHS